MPVKLALAAILLALMLSGGFCPKGATLPDDLEKTGLMLYISRSGSSNTMNYTNIEGSVQGIVGLGLSPALNASAGASLSPQRGRIVFAMVDTASSTTDLFVINRDGTGLANITSTAEVNEADPDWSRAGDRIAYAAGGDIWVVNADGTAPQNVTNSTDAIEADPSFSPDGAEIAFAVDPNATTTEIGVVTLANGARRTVVSDESLDASEPSWSPQSGRIAFSGIRTEGVVREEVDIWVVSAAGGTPGRVTDAGGDLLCRCPAWAPKEDRIAFRGTELGSSLSDVYTIHPDGGGLTRFRTASGLSQVFVDWR